MMGRVGREDAGEGMEWNERGSEKGAHECDELRHTVAWIHVYVLV